MSNDAEARLRHSSLRSSWTRGDQSVCSTFHPKETVAAILCDRTSSAAKRLQFQGDTLRLPHHPLECSVRCSSNCAVWAGGAPLLFIVKDTFRVFAAEE